MTEQRICSVDVCDRPALAQRTLCTGHRERKRHGGDMTTPIGDKYGRVPGDECSVPGCARPRLAQPGGGRYTLCLAHRARKNRTGDVGGPSVRAMHSGDVKVWCGYRTAHKRTANVRGAASGFQCVGCGNMAEEWSYRGGAIYEFTGGPEPKYANIKWSGDPSDYDARCKECHLKYDGKSA